MVYAIFLTTLVAIVLLFFAARKFFKKDLTGELLIGFFLGLFWEILTNQSWNYDTTRMITLFLGRAEIPIEILMGWSFVLAASILATEIIQKFTKHYGKLSFFAIGIFCIFAIGFSTEIIGINTGMWTYPENVDSGMYYIGEIAIPTKVSFGWMFFGMLFLIVTKYYHHVVERYVEFNLKKLARKISGRRRR